MPFADKEKNRAATRDWMRRHPERARAAKERWRAKKRRLRAATRVVKFVQPSYFRSAKPEVRGYYYKLRRAGVTRNVARALAFRVAPFS